MTAKEKWQIENFMFGLCGGWNFAAIWALFGLLWYVTYIGRPIAKCCFLIARFALKPHGRVIGTTGDYSFIGNVLWLLFVGTPWVFLFILIASVFAVTLIGVPVALAYLRLAGLVAAPVGMQLERQLEDWQWQ